jgi:hypothetical protein
MSTSIIIYSVHYECIGNYIFDDLESAEKWRDFLSFEDIKYVIDESKIEIDNKQVPEWYDKNDFYYTAYLFLKDNNVNVKNPREFIQDSISWNQISGIRVSRIFESGEQLDKVYTWGRKLYLYTKTNSIEKAKEKAITMFEDWFNKNN